MEKVTGAAVVVLHEASQYQRSRTCLAQVLPDQGEDLPVHGIGTQPVPDPGT